MEEIWRDIVGFNNYQVSNLGNVRSVKFGKIVLLKPSSCGRYTIVTLFKNGERHYRSVHRLVSEAFIPNPDNLPFVNHKDENTHNNIASNLEWCNAKYNCNYGKRLSKIAYSLTGKNIPLKYKGVVQIDDCGRIVGEYESLKETKKNGYNPGTICNCLKGRQKTAYGFKWEYKK